MGPPRQGGQAQGVGAEKGQQVCTSIATQLNDQGPQGIGARGAAGLVGLAVALAAGLPASAGFRTARSRRVVAVKRIRGLRSTRVASQCPMRSLRGLKRSSQRPLLRSFPYRENYEDSQGLRYARAFEFFVGVSYSMRPSF